VCLSTLQTRVPQLNMISSTVVERQYDHSANRLVDLVARRTTPPALLLLRLAATGIAKSITKSKYLMLPSVSS